MRSCVLVCAALVACGGAQGSPPGDDASTPPSDAATTPWPQGDSSFVFDDAALRIRADLDLVPDDDDPHAILALFEDATSEPIRSGRVAAGFRLDAANVKRWMESEE